MSQNSIGVDFSELKELNPFFKDQEKIMNATVLNSFMKGANVAKKVLKNATPAPLKKFNESLAAKKLKSTGGILSVLIGYFGRRIFAKKKKYNLDAWYILYWKNYGTLKKRAGDHAFQSPLRSGTPASGRAVRKDKVRTRFYTRGGITPLKFYDNAADSAMEQGMTAINESVEKELYKQVAKYGFKQ